MHVAIQIFIFLAWNNEISILKMGQDSTIISKLKINIMSYKNNCKRRKTYRSVLISHKKVNHLQEVISSCRYPVKVVGEIVQRTCLDYGSIGSSTGCSRLMVTHSLNQSKKPAWSTRAHDSPLWDRAGQPLFSVRAISVSQPTLFVSHRLCLKLCHMSIDALSRPVHMSCLPLTQTSGHCSCALPSLVNPSHVQLGCAVPFLSS